MRDLLDVVPLPMLKVPAVGALNCGEKVFPKVGTLGVAFIPKAGPEPKADVWPEKLRSLLFGGSVAPNENTLLVGVFMGTLPLAPNANVDWDAGVKENAGEFDWLTFEVPNTFDDVPPKGAAAVTGVWKFELEGGIKEFIVTWGLPNVVFVAVLPNPVVSFWVSFNWNALGAEALLNAGVATLLVNAVPNSELPSCFCCMGLFDVSENGAEEAKPFDESGFCVFKLFAIFEPNNEVLPPPNVDVPEPKLLPDNVPKELLALMSFVLAPNAKVVSEPNVFPISNAGCFEEELAAPNTELLPLEVVVPNWNTGVDTVDTFGADVVAALVPKIFVEVLKILWNFVSDELELATFPPKVDAPECTVVLAPGPEEDIGAVKIEDAVALPNDLEMVLFKETFAWSVAVVFINEKGLFVPNCDWESEATDTGFFAIKEVKVGATEDVVLIDDVLKEKVSLGVAPNIRVFGVVTVTPKLVALGVVCGIDNTEVDVVTAAPKLVALGVVCGIDDTKVDVATAAPKLVALAVVCDIDNTEFEVVTAAPKFVTFGVACGIDDTPVLLSEWNAVEDVVGKLKTEALGFVENW